MRINENPSVLVIWLGLTDRQIHYSSVDSYWMGSNGYGHMNTISPNTQYLTPNQYLPQEMTLTSPPSTRGPKWMFGINANVIYTTEREIIEDSMEVSEDFAMRASTVSIWQKQIDIPINALPVCAYGENKIFPDIGDYIRPDGVILAYRLAEAGTFLADIEPRSLNTVRLGFDTCIYGESRAKVIDITVLPAREKQLNEPIYAQIEKYHRAQISYWEAICKAFNDFGHQHACSEEFTSLVTNAITRLSCAGVKPPGGLPYRSRTVLASRRRQPIEFLQIEITYMTYDIAREGTKIVDRHGAKGVVCRVRPNHEMPVDDHGIRADVKIDTISPVNRLNGGQLYEADINRIGVFVQRKIEQLAATNMQAAIDTLFRFYQQIYPPYAELMMTIKGKSQQALEEHVRSVIANGVYLNIPPTAMTITPENLLLWEEEYKAYPTPVTMVVEQKDGSKVMVRTEAPMSIGSKYMMVLKSRPDPSSPGIGHVNQLGIPIKPSGGRNLHAINAKPVRMGEDEIRLLLAYAPAEVVGRLINLHAASPLGVTTLVRELLISASPTAIWQVPITNEQLNASSAPLNAMHHMLETAGIDSRHPVLVDYETTITALGEDQDPEDIFDDGSDEDDTDPTLANDIKAQLEDIPSDDDDEGDEE